MNLLTMRRETLLNLYGPCSRCKAELDCESRNRCARCLDVQREAGRKRYGFSRGQDGPSAAIEEPGIVNNCWSYEALNATSIYWKRVRAKRCWRCGAPRAESKSKGKGPAMVCEVHLAYEREKHRLYAKIRKVRAEARARAC